ncbi:MAG: MliC family protein [Methylophilaceae bacterium]|nr:MliC family protein [Methylophilaceae bacterium]
MLIDYRHRSLFTTCCLSILFLTACVTNSEVASTDKSVVKYACDRGTQLTATFSKDGSNVEISTNAVKNLILTAQPAASGFIYSNGRYELRGKGQEAMWPIGRMVPEPCLVNH